MSRKWIRCVAIQRCELKQAEFILNSWSLIQMCLFFLMRPAHNKEINCIYIMGIIYSSLVATLLGD